MRIALLLAVVCAFALPVSAQPRDHHRDGGWQRGGGHGGGYSRWHRPGWRYDQRGGGWYDPGAAIIGGAIGGWLWRQFNQPEPPVIVVPQEPMRDVAWCIQRYRSYNPATRTYLGYDGQFHGCP